MDKAELLYKASNSEISYSAEDSILICRWIGFQHEQPLKYTGEKMLEFLKARKCSKVLNINLEVIGPWHHSADWAREDWFIRMENAGLRYFAWVCPDDLLSRLSAERALPANGVRTQTFFEIEKAVQWLKSK